MPGDRGEARFAQIHYVRSIFSAIRRPTGLLVQWREITAALSRAVTAAPSGVLDFQQHRLRTGDFLATWAVELAVHDLDLRPDSSEGSEPAVATAGLRLARETIEALIEAPLPTDWTDRQAVLIGAGRLRLDQADRDRLGELVDRLPALG